MQNAGNSIGEESFPPRGHFPVQGTSQGHGQWRLAHLVKSWQRIIAVLTTRMNGWGMALWFESSNSYLAGKLPKDVLSSDPDAVVNAALDEIGGSSHG
ncbi:hypothetical protein D3C77_72940 [compost metagenome]